MFFEILSQTQQPSGGLGSIGIGYWVLLGATALVSMLISGRLKSRFAMYSQIPIAQSGAEVAEAMLRQNGINDVQVISVSGRLTDHYDPTKRTVNLSEAVYAQRNVAAAAVAAHECGHAIQHKEAYSWLTMRSKMVPAVQLSSQIMNVLMILMFVGLFALGSGGTVFIYVFLGAMAVTTLFSVITLPVEFDASKRALVWLNQSGYVRGFEHDKAKDALFWAAMTYVAGAVAAIAQLAYWAMMLLGRRD